MFYLGSLIAFAALVAAQAADPSIATPAAIVQCQPAQITFTATKTPVFISIIPGGQPSAAPLQDLGQQNASPFTWRASIPAGTQITFQIRDSTGAVAYSAPVSIQSSSDSSCLGAGASSAAGSASQSSASATSAAGSSSSAAAATSSVVEATSSILVSASSAVASASSNAASPTAPPSSSRAPTSVPSTSRTATATSAAISPSTTPNSARSNMQVGFAGLLGLAAAAVMA